VPWRPPPPPDRATFSPPPTTAARLVCLSPPYPTFRPAPVAVPHPDPTTPPPATGAAWAPHASKSFQYRRRSGPRRTRRTRPTARPNGPCRRGPRSAPAAAGRWHPRTQPHPPQGARPCFQGFPLCRWECRLQPLYLRLRHWPRGSFVHGLRPHPPTALEGPVAASPSRLKRSPWPTRPRRCCRRQGRGRWPTVVSPSLCTTCPQCCG